jgi:hypothetical protein
MTICKQCQQQFEITDADRAFYTKMQVPEPALCPPCRQRRRMVWRNERTLYARKCNATNKDILSIFKPEAPFPVYSPEVWNGDSWDQLATGRDVDFSRPFFPQFAELLNVAPRIALSVAFNENCPHVNQCWHCNE